MSTLFLDFDVSGSIYNVILRAETDPKNGLIQFSRVGSSVPEQAIRLIEGIQ
jgi:hypothetical protein